MTLITAIRRTDRMLVISDGAAIDDDANLVALTSKVVLIPSANAVIGCRGDAMVGSLFSNGMAQACAEFRTFDGLKAYVLGALRSTFDLLGGLPPESLNIDVVIAGWSETCGPDSFLIRTLEGSSLPTWQIIDLGLGILMPGNDDIFQEVGPCLSDQSVELTDEGSQNCSAGTSSPMDRSRSRRHGSVDFLQLTTITEREISTCVIHRWPDEIGRRINLLRLP